MKIRFNYIKNIEHKKVYPFHYQHTTQKYFFKKKFIPKVFNNEQERIMT